MICCKSGSGHKILWPYIYHLFYSRPNVLSIGIHVFFLNAKDFRITAHDNKPFRAPIFRDLERVALLHPFLSHLVSTAVDYMVHQGRLRYEILQHNINYAVKTRYRTKSKAADRRRGNQELLQRAVLMAAGYS